MPYFAKRTPRLLLALLMSALAALPAQRAAAVDLLGLYIGAGVGESQVEADAAGITVGSFKENHTAWKGLVGIRPVPFIGAEIEYVDLGKPSGSLGATTADVSMNGPAAFAMLYLPLPLPVIDVYAKAGLARLQSTVDVYPSATSISTYTSISRSNSNFAGGLGVQGNFGGLAVRGEYERFDAAGGHPGLFSLELIWTIL